MNRSEETELLAGGEAAAGFTSLSRCAGSRADTRGSCTAAAGAIRVVETLPSNELSSNPVTHVLHPVDVEGWATIGRCSQSTCRSTRIDGRRGGLHNRRDRCSSGTKAAAGLSSLELCTGSGADTGGVSAASTAAIGVAEALPADELSSCVVADILVS